MGKSSRRIWIEIGKQLEAVQELGSDGSPQYRWKRSDPSIADQLGEHAEDLTQQEKYEMLLKANAEAPFSSAATRRKWKRRLGL